MLGNQEVLTSCQYNLGIRKLCELSPPELVGSVELDHKAGISYATTALAHTELGTMQVLLTGGAYILSRMLDGMGLQK